MKFKMNNIEFTIKEVSQDEMKKWYCGDEEEGYYYGQTHFTAQEVWLDKSLSKERKRKTLMHELMHCYIREYLTTRDITPDEEVLCDLSANSHDMIHKIVEEYFKEVEIEDVESKYSCKSSFGKDEGWKEMKL